MGLEGEEPELAGFIEGIRMGSKSIIIGYAIEILLSVIMIIVLVFVFGTIFFSTIISGGFLTLPASIGGIILVLAVFYAGSVASAYFIYKGAKRLREGVEGLSHRVEALYTPFRIAYYSAILNLIGALTIIILVGVVITILAFIGWSIGLILLGYELKSRGVKGLEELEAPSTLFIIAGVLGLLGVSPIPFTRIFLLAALVAGLIAFYTLYNASEKLLEGP